jgi:DNA-binding NarL/FixJ family response regulator
MSQVAVKPISCLIGDDHAVVRSGLALFLSRQPDIEVVGQAGDGEAMLALIERRRTDVAIVDAKMPGADGIEVCRRVAAAGWGTAIVLYTAYEDLAVLDEALEAGAKGFVLKSSPPEDLARALRAAAGGATFVDSTLVSSLLTRREGDTRAVLSPRETEVLQLIADGLTTEAAAQKLFLSPATVRSYAESAMSKLETRNRTHAVAAALRLHLIE